LAASEARWQICSKKLLLAWIVAGSKAAEILAFSRKLTTKAGDFAALPLHYQQNRRSVHPLCVYSLGSGPVTKLPV
jgi:hypothetical protein